MNTEQKRRHRKKSVTQASKQQVQLKKKKIMRNFDRFFPSNFSSYTFFSLTLISASIHRKIHKKCLRFYFSNDYFLKFEVFLKCFSFCHYLINFLINSRTGYWNFWKYWITYDTILNYINKQWIKIFLEYQFTTLIHINY